MTNNNEAGKTISDQTVVESTSSLGQTAGILWIVFGIAWVIMFAIVFLPLNLVMTLIAIWKKKYLLWIVSGILTVAILLTSPTLWGLVALKGVYDKGIQEQTRIDKIAQTVIETKKQEDASKNEKTAVISPENKTPSIAADAGKCESTEWRNYIQSQEFFWDIYKVGWSRLDELTASDLDAVLYSPWLDSTFAAKVGSIFLGEVKKNRKEISSLSSGGTVPKIDAINGKYEYTKIGASLAIKYVYIGILESMRKNFDNGQDTEIEAKLKESHDLMKDIIKDFSSGKLLTNSGNLPTKSVQIVISNLGKDNKIFTQTFGIEPFPNGNFGILINTGTVANSTNVEIY